MVLTKISAKVTKLENQIIKERQGHRMSRTEQIKAYGKPLEDMTNDELMDIILPKNHQTDSVYKNMSTEQLTNYLLGRR